MAPKVRIAIIALLFALPWLFLMSVGSYHLWSNGWLFWAWWPMFLCFGLSYFLASRWTRKRGTQHPTSTPPPNYWTDRDKNAWEKVKAKAQSYDNITPELLANPRHYSDLAIDLAEQIAAIYHTGGATPFDHLTIPEVLTCIELASADLEMLVQKYVPGAHLLRIQDYQQVRKAADWYKTGQNVYWAASAIINPVEVGARWLSARYGLGTLLDRLQGNLLLWFHTAFVEQLGHYLIEMNSGRLKVGAKRYRELLQAHEEPRAEPVATPAIPAPESASTGDKPIVVAVLGPVKAGKSSLVNALLGQQAATVDALPVDRNGMRYHLKLNEKQPAVIIDTAGYGQGGINSSEFELAAEAAREADLVLFVTPATNPGRGPDIDFLDRLASWFKERPNLKMPPIIAAVNQVDLLSPRSEWNPPYDWKSGAKPKELAIKECVSAVREQILDRVIDVLPVCSRHGETQGIREDLIPAIASQLDEARGAAVLRAFAMESSTGQIHRIGQQVVEGGKKAISILWENLKKSNAGPK